MKPFATGAGPRGKSVPPRQMHAEVAAGEPLKSFKTASVAAVLRAHVTTPHWRKPGYKDLTPDCRRGFGDITTAAPQTPRTLIK